MDSLFHDDITWCMDDCPIQNCMRNPANMQSKTGLHSYAFFKGTETCPVYGVPEGCVGRCPRAQEFFAAYEDPDVALRELAEQYCETCLFSATEED